MKKVAAFSKESIISTDLYFSLIDDKLYLLLDRSWDENNNITGGMYCLNEKNNFELMKVKEEGTGDKVRYKMNNGMDYDDFTTLCNILGDS